MKLLSLLQTALVAGGIAALANAIIYFISKNTGILNDNILLPPGKPLRLMAVIFSSLIPAIVAGFLLFVLLRLTTNPERIFLILSFSVMIISIIVPLTTLKIPMSAKLVLCLMHLVAGAIIIFTLKKYAI